MSTTQDCKNFLAEHFKQFPEQITAVYGSSCPVVAAQRARIWKRDAKTLARNFYTDDSLVSPETDEELIDAWVDGKMGHVKAKDIANVRRFSLEPDHYDSAIRFLVLEGIDGKLYLGEFVGD